MKNKSQFSVTEEGFLMDFLIKKMPEKSRSNIKSLLTHKQIVIDGAVVSRYDYGLKIGQKIEILANRGQQEVKCKGLTIVFEDEHIIVINKQEGTLSISTDKSKDQNAYSTLSDHVKRANVKNRIFVVHRLDRETSGLMMFAKSQDVQAILQESWGPTTKERQYLALTEGVPERQSDTISSYLQETKALKVFSAPSDSHGGQFSVTHYETLRKNNYNALLKVSLETGRKNQVRVHMSDIGTPIVGDKKYGAKSNPIGRLGLHAWVLAFKHPISGLPMRFETPIPKKFADLF